MTTLPAAAAWWGWLACISWGAIGLYRRWADRPNAVVVVVLWSSVVPAVWLLALDLVGLRWSAWLVAVPAVATLLLGVFGGRSRLVGRPAVSVWGCLGSVVAVSSASLIAMEPSTSWDFRYIWGLKARVFALAGANDARWLGWAPNGWHHPDYPPLWPDIMAGGLVLGGSIETIVAVWQTMLGVGLAAACWDIMRNVTPAKRLAGVAVGAFAPTIIAYVYRGNAELLVAFLSAVALASLLRILRGGHAQPAWVATLLVAVAGLSLAKSESMVFAFGVVIAALLFVPKRPRSLVAATFVASVGAWQIFLSVHRIAREPRRVELHELMGTGKQIAAWVWHQPWISVRLLVVAWMLAIVALLLRRSWTVLTVVVVWGAGVVAAYLTVADPIIWRLTTSLERVISAPLPGVVAASLSAALGKPDQPVGSPPC